jgi:hypothetical protein
LYEQDEQSKLDGEAEESAIQTTPHNPSLEETQASGPEENITPQQVINEVTDHWLTYLSQPY